MTSRRHNARVARPPVPPSGGRSGRPRGLFLRGVSLCLGLAASAAASDLTLAVNLRWQGAPVVVPAANLPGAPGQTLHLTRFAAIVSGVELVRPDGGVVQFDGQYGFLDAESGRLSFALRNVPEGDYVGLAFQIGLPAALNHADPARWLAGHPLNPIVNGLHWSWAGGYIFAAIEGRWRAGAGDSLAAAERGFSYHLATDERLMRVRFATLFRVTGPTSVGLALDLGKLLGARALAADDGSESTHSGPGDPLAVALTTAMERAWFFLEATPTDSGAAAIEPAAVAVAPAGNATPRGFFVPAGFPQPALPADNPLTDEGVALGARLFHDRRLSAGGVQSCASCHREELAFADGQSRSLGVDGQLGPRNSMPLFNLAWNPAYAWDGSMPRIRDQVRAAMINPVEMHADLATVIAELSRDDAARAEFQAAFGTAEISADRVVLALEQYLLTLVAADSKFDRALRGEAPLTAEEQRGFELFATEFDPVRGQRGADCFHCHGGVLFSDFGFRDNGLGQTSPDVGREGVTGRTTDRAKFKTPSLRNIAATAPYMHDGRFATLEDVVAHYDHGLVRTSNLDPNLAKHPDSGLRLSADDQRALVAFLRTLTEATLLPTR